MAVSVPPIPNADQGVAVSLNYALGAYCSSTSYTNFNDQVTTGCVPEQDFHRLVLISGGAVVSDSAVNVTSQEGTFSPILQAEDGTYFGTGVTADNSMDAFDLSGNVKWSVPNFTPVMATADGGLIAKQLSTGQYETFDQNGVANGMRATLPTYSWLANAYQDGPLDRVAAFPPHYAPSFLAMPGGSNSPDGTAVHQTPFPPLASCNDPTLKNPPACPGPAEVANSGMAALKKLLSQDCPPCRQWVFAKLPGGSGNGDYTVEGNFRMWLNKAAGLYNGSISNEPEYYTCEEQFLGRFCDGTWRPFGKSLTIASWFAMPDNQSATNLAKWPSHNGYVSFYKPFYWGGEPTMLCNVIR